MIERNLISGKTAILIGIIIAVALTYLGITDWISVLIALIITIYIANIRAVGSGSGSSAESSISGSNINFGGIFRVIMYIIIILAILSYGAPMLNKAINGDKENPLNNVFYVESQTGNGLVENRDKQGINLATGSGNTGTTFLLRTKTTETGWPAFATGMYASKEGATLKVSFVDTDNPAKSILFKKIPIPTAPGFSYSNKYKLNNARAWKYEGQRQLLPEIDNINTAYRKDPMTHYIEIEVYVPPNSYVFLDNMNAIRGW